MNKIVIVVGILCILFLYAIPVPVYPVPYSSHMSVGDLGLSQCSSNPTLTIAQLSGSVSNPMTVGSINTCASMIGGPSYELYSGLFYIGWIIGILCVLYGFFFHNRNPFF